MRSVLWLCRKLAGSFRRWPHWAKDLYGVVAYVNFLELIPTLVAIALVPRHFFRRLPLVLAHRRRMYQTPIKFFVNFASLFLAVFYFRHGTMNEVMEEAAALWYMPLLIPITPLFMAALALVCWSLYQLPRVLPMGSDFPQPNPYPLWLVLAPSSFWNLGAQRYFWGLFYVSVYAVAAWQFAQPIIGYSLLTTNGLLGLTSNIIVQSIIVVVVAVLMAMIVHGLVFRPYAEMFRMSLRRLPRTVFHADVYDISEEVKEFLAAGRLARTHEGVEQFRVVADQLLARLEETVRIQEHDDVLTDADRQARADVFAASFQEVELRRAVEELPGEISGRFETTLSTMRMLQMPDYRDGEQTPAADSTQGAAA